MGGCCGKEDSSAQETETERTRLLGNRRRHASHTHSEGSDSGFPAGSPEDPDGTLKAILHKTVRTIIDIRDGAEIDHQDRIRRYHDHVGGGNVPRPSTALPPMKDLPNLDRSLEAPGIEPGEFVKIVTAGEAASEALSTMAPPPQDDLLVSFDG